MEFIYILYIVVGAAFIPVLIWGICTQISVNTTFERFSAVQTANTADSVAQKILSSHGIHDVKITQIPGSLTDNFDSRNKTLSLSESVYGRTNISAIGVAAHECGHAIQHKEGYLPLKIRTFLVPIVNFFSRMFLPLLFIGILFSAFSNFFYSPIFIYVALGFYGFSLLFSLATLPVEFNASSRAIAEIEKMGIMTNDELYGTKRVLRAAAMTYVVSFVTSLIYFLHFVLRLLIIFGNSRRR